MLDISKLNRLQKLVKTAFVDQGAMAPPGGPPPMDPAMMGMDPAMMGGAPPMDPAMMGMDPAMMGGAPPMDPAMMGMDPAMMGGMPPMDPAMLQQAPPPGIGGSPMGSPMMAMPPGAPPMDPSMAGPPPIDPQMIKDIVMSTLQEAGINPAGGEGGGKKGGNKIEEAMRAMQEENRKEMQQQTNLLIAALRRSGVDITVGEMMDLNGGAMPGGDPNQLRMEDLNPPMGLSNTGVSPSKVGSYNDEESFNAIAEFVRLQNNLRQTKLGSALGEKADAHALSNYTKIFEGLTK